MRGVGPHLSVPDSARKQRGAVGCVQGKHGAVSLIGTVEVIGGGDDLCARWSFAR